MNYIPFIMGFSFILFLLIFWKLYSRYLHVLRRKNLYENFEVLNDVYKHSIEVSYKNIYRTDILAYIASGYSLDDEFYVSACKKFIQFVFIYLGSKFVDDLIFMYGNKESIITYLTNEFSFKVQDDFLSAKNVAEKQTEKVNH